MAKNIIICSDGTGNTAIKNRGTNVFKIFESVDLNSHRYHPERSPQVAIYDDGVGTERFKPLKLIAGASGFGLSRNVKQLYKELCRIYDPGDRIFLFGFSRGAFTVRTLCGLIATCGILKIAEQPGADVLEARVRETYKVYRRRYRTALAKLLFGEPDPQEIAHYKRDHCHGEEKIAFIGVWDTVDAVGLPLPIADFINRTIYRFKFPDLTLSPCVERAYHALAIDDERQSFHPLLWDRPAPGAADGQVIEQVWFAGAHSNVGGGYPKQGMSLVALDWIMQRAEQAGLRFVAAERRYYQDHANVDDKLYNPRAGLGMFYRWLPRDIGEICARRRVTPAIHLSVLERAAHGTEDYAPGNLPPDARVVITETGQEDKDRAALERAAEAQAVLRRSRTDGRSLLASVSAQVRTGRYSHRLFLFAWVALLFSASAPPGLEYELASLGDAARGALAMLTSPPASALDVPQRLFTSPWRIAVPALAFAASFAMAEYANRNMRRTFSRFWFAQQQELRAALKRARRTSSTGM